MRDPFYRLSTEIKIPAEGLDLARTTLGGGARAIEWRTRDRDPEVFLDHRDSSTATYTVAVWIDDPWSAPMRRSDFNEALWKSLEAHQ